MKQTFYFFNEGRISRKDNTLIYKNLEGDKKVLPIETISDLYIMTEMDFNTKLISFLAKYGITVHFFNYYDFYVGSFYPREKLVSGELLIKQVSHNEDIFKRLEIAKEFVGGAADNIYRNLRYYNERERNLELSMNTIDHLRRKINFCESINELMGIEGNIRKDYYKCFTTIINGDFDFEKRVKRPPDNVINTLISFVNSVIYTKVLSQVYMTQLNPTVSYLHQSGERRFSLCLDLAEIFKPLIGDHIIFSLLNKNQITENDFTEELNYMHLKKKATQTIMVEIDKKLKSKIMHRELNRKVSYEYLIRLECYKLIKHLIGEKEYKAFRIWW
ncbi:CRISPR-associated protein, Cas1 family [Peptoclostridium litorale DSM 5388]|uniref:CRISPR-associated endonuclease Cas1 n=1 Tax=Peptoclostridium litorale DSM 5388 TaxID=1121324 RepID=A0A069RFD5_PEPLI|nr:type I-B CRISPR-associated endonuclease Cas1b [Peptoclostridium litorale]KDR95716.1 CRISPR-associated endonuclease Cas1 [Peptoclostridium litorale DSM 5388]SIO22766.1 CRISPR-associated protein, Cas1 family [Peptoclostridium litorale DSM 5388]